MYVFIALRRDELRGLASSSSMAGGVSVLMGAGSGGGGIGGWVASEIDFLRRRKKEDFLVMTCCNGGGEGSGSLIAVCTGGTDCGFPAEDGAFGIVEFAVLLELPPNTRLKKPGRFGFVGVAMGEVTGGGGLANAGSGGRVKCSGVWNA